MEVSDFRQPIYHDLFDQYIYQCWREGKKVRDIVSGWDDYITEDDILPVFKKIMKNYFERYYNGN